MANWNSILQEIQSLLPTDPAAYDTVRRRKIAAVCQITQRPLMIYATDFATINPLKAQLVASGVQISVRDVDGFDEVTRNLPAPNLDVLLYSPGGSAEAAESIVALLRARFSHIRFFVPGIAKSAATMLAMSGDELVLDELSELGPTDPQMLMIRDGQPVVAPAQAIKDQFEAAQRDISADPNRLPAWVPILRFYGPSLLAECDNHLALSRDLVSDWLEHYMFAGDPTAAQKADVIASYLADHNQFRSHGRRVGIDQLKARSVKILDLRTDSALHTAVRDLHSAIMHTLDNTGCYKMFENSMNEAVLEQVVQPPPQPPPTNPTGQGPTPRPTPPPGGRSTRLPGQRRATGTRKKKR